MGGIFISYRRSDTAGYAGRLLDRLVAKFGTEQVFRDIDTIAPGVDFVAAVDQAVRSCDALLVLIGRDWLGATDSHGRPRLQDPQDFPRMEVSAALERDILVIPILMGGAAMPSADDLPASMQRLARINALELTDSHWDYDVERLVERLDDVVNLAGAAPVTAPSPPEAEAEPAPPPETEEPPLVQPPLPVPPPPPVVSRPPRRPRRRRAPPPASTLNLDPRAVTLLALAGGFLYQLWWGPRVLRPGLRLGWRPIADRGGPLLLGLYLLGVLSQVPVALAIGLLGLQGSADRTLAAVAMIALVVLGTIALGLSTGRLQASLERSLHSGAPEVGRTRTARVSVAFAVLGAVLAVAVIVASAYALSYTAPVYNCTPALFRPC